ncbi:Hypothetical protein PHPALM_36904 [Phytophthora palmivora]|uniref:Uncharacterized protein n=1 Tax=Phytophthora palmivora TaxID=4796 RepID=A0A2P4WYT8_9STRA|nr:Hypothetical protein PHPALM_36904 [Phytophthora palmivora]
MAAAEALLAYKPLQQLQHENFLLREENRRVRSEVRELLAWKEKAVAHMAAMAPARRRAVREVERAKQLQQQLRTVESSLKSRGALELATTELEAERETLQQRVEVLKHENAELKLLSDRRKRRADDAEAQLTAMGESFRLHLERLVAIRESLDEVSSGDVKNNKEDSAAPPSVPVNSAAFVTGLDAIATKCLSWLQEHFAQSFAQQQLKATRYEAQHEEVQRLKEQVQAASHIPEKQAEEHAKLSRELAELREAHEHLQQQATNAEQMVVAQRQRREDMAVRMRLVAGEVRQYLRLVRGEIKRKFGYLPEAIAHAESWTRIAEALELLLCQSTDRCVVRNRK